MRCTTWYNEGDSPGGCGGEVDGRIGSRLSGMLGMTTESNPHCRKLGSTKECAPRLLESVGGRRENLLRAAGFFWVHHRIDSRLLK